MEGLSFNKDRVIMEGKKNSKKKEVEADPSRPDNLANWSRYENVSEMFGYASDII